MSNSAQTHVIYLSSELKKRQHRNARYSLRSFARDLEVSPSWMSEVLNSKKGMSRAKATSLATLLGLSAVEAEAFALSAQAAHSRSATAREDAVQRLKKLEKKSSIVKKMSEEDMTIAGSWYFNAILELIEVNKAATPEWIAKRLRLPGNLVAAALDKMLGLGWVRNEAGQLSVSFSESETDYDLPSASIKNYHDEVMDQAKLALFELGVHEREFINMTVAFDSGKLAEAKRAIRAFQKDFAEKFYQPEQKSNSVYQLSVQLFRLDRDEV